MDSVINLNGETYVSLATIRGQIRADVREVALEALSEVVLMSAQPSRQNSARQEAARLGICVKTLHGLRKAGTVPARKLGSVYRFDSDAVDAALTAAQQEKQ